MQERADQVFVLQSKRKQSLKKNCFPSLDPLACLLIISEYDDLESCEALHLPPKTMKKLRRGNDVEVCPCRGDGALRSCESGVMSFHVSDDDEAERRLALSFGLSFGLDRRMILNDTWDVFKIE